MAALGKESVSVTRYIRNLRGGSSPVLVEASDGRLYVAKISNSVDGPNVAFNESAGSELYRACGLAVPEWMPLQLTDGFLDATPECWIEGAEGAQRPNAGVCFGSRFLGGAGVRLLEILPGTSMSRVRNSRDFWLAWMIDICAGHADNRQAIFVDESHGWMSAFFIDNGHLFGGPKGELRPHFLASRYLDPRIYKHVSSEDIEHFQKVASSLDVDRLWREIHALPEDWTTASAIEGLNHCLGRLSTPRLLQGVLETMIAADDKANGYAIKNYERGPKPSMALLCPGVQAA
jgi:hypothetical protein